MPKSRLLDLKLNIVLKQSEFWNYWKKTHKNYLVERSFRKLEIILDFSAITISIGFLFKKLVSAAALGLKCETHNLQHIY
jgi:hypothetical protein